VRPEGLPAGVIAERLGVQPSSPSFHLAQLVHADLITQRYLSRQLIYSVSGSGVSMTALGHIQPFDRGREDGLLRSRSAFAARVS
jgi:DNA-binding transcriptional ArsR family regulator